VPCLQATYAQIPIGTFSCPDLLGFGTHQVFARVNSLKSEDENIPTDSQLPNFIFHVVHDIP